MNQNIVADLHLKREGLVRRIAAIDATFKIESKSCEHRVGVTAKNVREEADYFICEHADFPKHRSDICELKYCPVAKEGPCTQGSP